MSAPLHGPIKLIISCTGWSSMPLFPIPFMAPQLQWWSGGGFGRVPIILLSLNDRITHSKAIADSIALASAGDFKQRTVYFPFYYPFFFFFEELQ